MLSTQFLGEIPASVARLTGEVLKHQATWITWTICKFLETHHSRCDFFQRVVGWVEKNIESRSTSHMDLSKRLEIFGHRKKVGMTRCNEVQRTPPLSAGFCSFFFFKSIWVYSFWLDAIEEISPKPRHF